MRVRLLLPLVLLMLSCRSPRLPTDLEATRDWLARVEAGEAVRGPGGASASGYRFHCVYRWSGNRTVIILSREDAGTIWLFDARGTAALPVADAADESVTLADLDEDGNQELITSEVVPRGTGVYDEAFNFYGVGAHQLERLWSGVSRSIRMPPDGEITPTVGYLRLDRGRGDEVPRLTNIVFSDARPPQLEVVRVSAGEPLRISVERRAARFGE